MTFCFRSLNKRSASGVDHISAREYGKNLKEHVKKLVGVLKRKSYRAKLVKRRYIPKANGKMRPLGIPATEDKLLQLGVKNLLEPIYEQDFLDCSYGYRPNKGARDAVLEAKSKLWGLNYVVEADIKGFFDAINHEWLEKMLALRVNDRALLNLIVKWLKAGVLEPEGEIKSNESGTPQGGIISPLLANVYLHYVLDLWFEKVVKKQVKGKAHMVRYADDFICMFQYKSDAETFYKNLPKRLGKFDLCVAPDKTKILHFNRWNKDQRFQFLGFEFYWAKNHKGKDCLYLQTSSKKLRSALKNVYEWCKVNRHKKLRWLYAELNVKLEGHYQYYGVIGNYRRLSTFYYFVERSLIKWLNRRSHRKGFTWDRYKALKQHFKLKRPKITMETKYKDNFQYSF